MSLEVWISFTVTSLLLLVIPGPTILTVISYAIAHGSRASLPLVTAVCLGDSTALALSILGLGAVLSASALWFSVVKICGGLYLFYLAFNLLRAGVLPIAPEKPEVREGNLFFHTWLVTALNPKGIVFFVAFLPQFVDPAQHLTKQLWILSITFVSLAALNTVLYCLFASAARQLFESAAMQRKFNLLGGGLLGVAGLWALRSSA